MKERDIINWLMLIDLMLEDIDASELCSVRPAHIALDCDLDTETLEIAYAKSEYIKEYNKDGC